MPKLLNIKGYWKEHPYSDFNEIDIWEGKILLEEDGWFEGIAKDPIVLIQKIDLYLEYIILVKQ